MARTGRPKHILTTEERRRGQARGAETKRRNRAERRARQQEMSVRGWSPPVRETSVRETRSPEEDAAYMAAMSAAPVVGWSAELCCPHGICTFNCEWCGGREHPDDGPPLVSWDGYGCEW